MRDWNDFWRKQAECERVAEAWLMQNARVQAWRRVLRDINHGHKFQCYRCTYCGMTERDYLAITPSQLTEENACRGNLETACTAIQGASMKTCLRD